ncbi:hypothetical protein AFM11_34330 [Mycolicibacterium wolinskyi]|uniref:Uncharacterized protein n=1 Tax=Mycolicibacterium wolinskyi TaxID=59750 RepID=A0A132PCL2_9MYCO|nr:hypothetical protein [Mycolicibacterium wolinskyi]KWX19722.1 hypothetical protein AFM11_34330 [Mycolicibacterium wolinskyi]
MSLDKLESQLEGLRAQAASIQKRWARTRDNINNDNTLTDIGKKQKLDAEREQVSTKLSGLRKQETEAVAAQKQSLEKSLFGLGVVDSTYTDKIMSYRDAHDRAGRLELQSQGQELLASAMRSDDKILAAAVLAKALASEWRSVIAEYLKQNPRAGDDLNDLAKLQGYSPLEAGFSYVTT